jgi:hypothetical protein
MFYVTDNSITWENTANACLFLWTRRNQTEGPDESYLNVEKINISLVFNVFFALFVGHKFDGRVSNSFDC